MVLLIGMISWIIFTNDKQLGGVRIGSMVTQTDNTHSIARLLFREFLLPFEITSVLILIAIMGAVVLAGRRR